MATFYKLDTRTPGVQSMDMTGAVKWDSTEGSGQDSTSTGNTNFLICGTRAVIPYTDNPFDSTWGESDYQQFDGPAIFQCPAGYLAYFTELRLIYNVPQIPGQNYAIGDSTNAITWAKLKFFVTGMPLDTTSSVWSPTNYKVDLMGVPGQPASGTYELLSPINRPLVAGESVDLRVLPFDGPINYAWCMYNGYLVATDSTT